MDSPSGRTLLLPINGSEGCQKALEWTLANFYKKGDTIHFFLVVPVPAPEVIGSIAGYGGVDDFLVTQPDPRVDQKHVADARKVIAEKFVPKCQAANAQFDAEIVHFATDNDSIGQIICRRAEALSPAAVVVAKHNQGVISEFFLGSVTKYLTHNCKYPVLVLHP